VTEWIRCIDADIYKNEDGTLNCTWLTPYYGDMTEEEYHKAGTALSVKRGCVYCYAMLEWRMKCRDEGWNYKETVCQGSHPDWPGEICQINKVIDSARKLIGYESQFKFYSLLHELEFYGWELQYGYYGKGKEIYKEEDEVKENCTTCMFGSMDKNRMASCSEKPKKGKFKPDPDCMNYTPEANGRNFNYSETFDNGEKEENEEEDKVKEDCLTCGECEDLTESGRCSNLYSDEHSKNKKAENAACDSFRLKGCIEKLSIETSVSGTVQVFDYSTVDAETAGFLQEKAQKITEIRIKSVVAIGKELKEAQDKLSNNKTGTFGAWSQSIGLSRQTVQNYIQGYDYIVKNFDNIEAADNIQPSLLFAASKPSASKELSEKVFSGDITTHKQYKELEEKLKMAKEHIEKTNKYADEHMKRARDAEMEVENKEKSINQLSFDKNFKDKEIQNLKQQLDQVKHNGDPDKIKRLEASVIEQADKLGNLEEENERLKKQFKAKPIEVPATREVEVIPDEVKNSIYSKVAILYEGLLNLTETEIRIFVESIDPDYCDDVAAAINAAINVLEKIDSAILEAQS
jgi:hypothetical protein